MSGTFRPHGLWTALVTPFSTDLQVDYDSLRRLIEFQIDEGVDGVLPCGTTGESPTLSWQEHDAVIEFTIQRAAGRVPVIAGTGSNNTTEAVRLTGHAKDAGADACLIVNPYYNKPTQEGLYRHFQAIADAVEHPVMLYNVPGRTAIDMSNDTVERLADIGNVVGIKDATGDLQRGRELIQRVGDRMAVYSGDDPTAMELMLAGGKGNVSVTANVAPRQMAELCRLAMTGERDAAAADSCGPRLAFARDRAGRRRPDAAPRARRVRS